jgi:hypothetical protein
MAPECRYCGKPRNVESCDERVGIIEGSSARPRRPYVRDLLRTVDPHWASELLDERCSGCGVADRGTHHPGCDQETCWHGYSMPTLPRTAEDGCHYPRPLTAEERFSGKDPRDG